MPEIIAPISEIVSLAAMGFGLVVMTMIFAVLIGQVVSRLFDG